MQPYSTIYDMLRDLGGVMIATASAAFGFAFWLLAVDRRGRENKAEIARLWAVRGEDRASTNRRLDDQGELLTEIRRDVKHLLAGQRNGD